MGRIEFGDKFSRLDRRGGTFQVAPVGKEFMHECKILNRMGAAGQTN